MIQLLEGGAYLVDGRELIPDDAQQPRLKEPDWVYARPEKKRRKRQFSTGS